jgi:hypothetical protein
MPSCARAYVHSLQTQTERLVTLYNSLMQTLCGFSSKRAADPTKQLFDAFSKTKLKNPVLNKSKVK